MGTGHRQRLPLRTPGFYADDPPLLHLKPHNAVLHMQGTPRSLELGSRSLPHLTRPIFWVDKFLDERGLSRCGIAQSQDITYGMPHGRPDRQTFDSLSTPFSADLTAGHTPDFLSIFFEELAIQSFSKAIDQEVFK